MERYTAAAGFDARAIPEPRNIVAGSLRPLALVLLAGCVSSATSLDPTGGGPVVVLPRRCPGCEAVRHVTVLDADGPRSGRRVLLFDGGIVADEPDDGRVEEVALELDGTGKTLIPGLWDAHAHVMAGADGTPESAWVPEALKGFVYSGVTSVLDMGADGVSITRLRARLKAGELYGPTVYAAAKFITSPGGHPCRAWSPASCIPIGAPDDAVAQLAPLQPDFVKIIVEAGGGPAPLPTFPRLTAGEIAAVTQAAHARSFKVAAHISSSADLDDVMAAGVDFLAHLPVRSVMTDAQADLVAQRKTPVITTLSFYDGLPRVLDRQADFDLPFIAESVPVEIRTLLRDPQVRAYYLTGAGSPVTDTWRSYLANMKASLAKVRARGGVIVAGSDCGNFAVFHGAGLVRELELLTGAGLTVTEAISAATAAPAELMGVGDRVGRVRAGQRADLVLVPGELGSDITRLRAPEQVWLAGRRIDRAKLKVSQPRSALVVAARALPEDEFCTQDSECAAPLKCHDERWRCTKGCVVTNPTSCPAGFACFAKATSMTEGFCEATDGCDPLSQNCPFAAAYGSTCVPFESDFSACLPSGTAGQGAACAKSQQCAQGLACGPGKHCEKLCTPPSGTCPASTSCMDETASYGQTVGLCR